VGEERREYEWLFRAAYPGVLRTAFLIVHDRGRAEEVSQEAFLQLLEHWGRVSQYERPDAWVRRVAIRMAVKQAKRDRSRVVLERSVRPVREDPAPDIDLSRAIATLAPMQRAVVVLYYLEDRPVLEIARVLQVSESTIKQHLHRARARLAVLLDEEVTEDVR